MKKKKVENMFNFIFNNFFVKKNKNAITILGDCRDLSKQVKLDKKEKDTTCLSMYFYGLKSLNKSKTNKVWNNRREGVKSACFYR